MIRRAFTMRLKPDALAEYKQHHDNIWPELVAEIERSGVAQITTFQRGLDLFLFSQITDEGAWNRLWTSPVHRRWAEVMEPLMHLRDDGIVDAGELTEIFHLQTPVAGQSHGKPSKAAKTSARKQPAKTAKMPSKPGKKGKKPLPARSLKKKTAPKKSAAKKSAVKSKASTGRKKR